MIEMEVIKGGEESPVVESFPSVQEIVRKDPCLVPDKFIQDEEERPKETLLSHLSSQIPTIDFSLLSKWDSDELKKLDMACKDWGFFQIINHGVDEHLLRKAKNVVADYFKLPLEEKHRYLNCLKSSDEMQANEQIVESNYQKLDWVDLLHLHILPLSHNNLKTWPDTPPHFRDTLQEYSDKINKIAKVLLANISTLLDLDKATLEELHGDLHQTFNANYYPPCSRPGEVFGLSPHSDSNTITIILQDDDITALHLNHDGGWVPINPIAGAFLVNIGDCIEIWSNGIYKSILHRVVTNNSKARTSLITFMEPAPDTFVEPIPKVLQGEEPRLYKKVKYGEYVMYYITRDFKGKYHTRFTKVGNE